MSSEDVGSRIKEARKKNNMTTYQLAKLVDMSQAAISSLENGVAKSSTKLTLIAQKLNVDPLWLATGCDERTYSDETKEVVDLMEKQTDRIGRGKILYAAKEIVEMRQSVIGAIKLNANEQTLREAKKIIESFDERLNANRMTQNDSLRAHGSGLKDR